MSRRRAWAEDNKVEIDLAAGASVTLSFRGNLFDMTQEEQQLIFDLTKTIKDYKTAKANGLMAAKA